MDFPTLVFMKKILSMNKSQRVYFDTGNTGNDKFIKVRLEQNVETLEFLSMSLTTEEVYQSFNADYGVLVGRVLANGGIGIPNARISIFIPLSDIDAEDGEISGIYPYKTPRDKNAQGKRYNLLPRVAKVDPNTGIITPKQPFGSFPIKEEILTNEPFLNVYKKYYKYTALTNDSGDYMIFGVPTGTQTVHLSVDITDIGEYSMTPAAMVTNLGYSPNLFTDNNSRIKPSSDLNDLPNIETQEISVNVIPFWGDTVNFEIGITRQDFRIRSVLKNTFVIFGSVFTDGYQKMWGNDYNNEEYIRNLYNMTGGNDVNVSRANMGIKYKKVGKVTEKVYYYPESISDGEIDSGNFTDQMLLLDPSEYSVYKRDGDFAIIVSCNRDKIATGEMYTKFRGFITLEITEDDLPLDWIINSNHVKMKPIRHRLKFPQYGKYLVPEDDSLADTNNKIWRNQHYTFSGGCLYSIAAFHPTVFNNTASPTSYDEVVNHAIGHEMAYNVGIIQTNNIGNGAENNTDYEMVSNVLTTDSRRFWGANWLNLSVYLPQAGFVYDGYNYIDNWRVNRQFSIFNKSTYYAQDNTQPIVGSYLNTKWFARADRHWTDIINVPKTDILKMNHSSIPKGFKGNDVADGLDGTTYRNGDNNNVPADWYLALGKACPDNGGKVNATGVANDPQDLETYFFKGFNTANCIEFIVSLGLV